MKHLIKIRILSALAALAAVSLLCSCSPANSEVKDSESESVFSDETEKEESGEKGEAEQDEEETAEAAYVKPSTFSGAYYIIADMRNAFYDAAAASMTAAGENTSVFADAVLILKGEASFVGVSACGTTGCGDLIETVLGEAGYANISYADNDGKYTITGIREGANYSFEAYYDTEKDSFYVTSERENAVVERIYSVRADGEFLVQYLGDDSYIRYILRDDGTAQMYVYEAAMWEDEPSADTFANAGFLHFYEIKADRFHAVHSGIEFTYPLADADSEETDIGKLSEKSESGAEE